MTDPIADMLIRIKNGQQIEKNKVDIPHSKLKAEVAKLLVQQGFIEDFKRVKRKKINNQRFIRVFLKYKNGLPMISSAKRVSKPGRKVYKGTRDINLVKSGYGISVISTSKGLMTDKEAKKQGVGGELLFEVW